MVQACMSQTYIESKKNTPEAKELFDNGHLEKLGEAIINYHTIKRFCYEDKSNQIDP